MLSKDDIQRFRTIERRHMIRVKGALAAALARPVADPAVLRGCVDYLEFIVGRFVAQGRGNVQRLRAAIPPSDTASCGVVKDIEQTLATTRAQLEQLVAARDTDHLADACHTFVEFYDGTLARRKNPAQDIVDRYIDAETYWRETNDVTDESIATERTLFQHLAELAPELVQPDRD